MTSVVSVAMYADPTGRDSKVRSSPMADPLGISVRTLPFGVLLSNTNLPRTNRQNGIPWMTRSYLCCSSCISVPRCWGNLPDEAVLVVVVVVAVLLGGLAVVAVVVLIEDDGLEEEKVTDLAAVVGVCGDGVDSTFSLFVKIVLLLLLWLVVAAVGAVLNFSGFLLNS